MPRQTDLDLGSTKEPEPEKIFSVPSDDHFIVGELQQLPSESSIIEFKEGKLKLEIVGTPISKEALALAQDALRVVSDRDEKALVGFRFQEFVFSSFEPRLQTQHPGNQSYIWESGFQFGVRFLGDIEILPGLFQMRGELRHDCVYALNVVTADVGDLKRISLFKNLNEAIVNIEPLTTSSGVTSDDEIEALRSISKLENLTRLWLKSDRHFEMPHLRNLDISGNPFQSLPSILSKISRVRIEHEKRALYMDLSYPHNKFIEFLAQLNFAELSELQNYLPRQGLLSIFIDQWNDFPVELRTLYSTDITLVTNQKLPASEILSDGETVDAYPGAPTSPVLLVSIPDSSPNEEIEEAYDALKRDLDDESKADHVRLSPHTINAHVLTQGHAPERDAAEKKLGHENEWMS